MSIKSHPKKLVYVLASDPADHFTEMAILSVHCARKFSPELEVEVVIDDKTFNNLKGYRQNILHLVNQVHVISVEGETNAFISRAIKTQLRKFIEGDYLYIDIDAIPIADLSEVFEIQTDLAMVNDHNLPPKKFVFLEYEREIFDKMQWSLPAEYYNSGVMFVKDTDLTHDFFKRWHELWLLNCAIGLHKDQPAMHEAIRQKKIKVTNLSSAWNMLIGSHKAFPSRNPKIYHYSTINFDTRVDTYFHKIVRDMKRKKEIDFNLLEKVIKSKYPWTNQNSFKLNWGVGNYHKLPLITLKRIFNR